MTLLRFLGRFCGAEHSHDEGNVRRLRHTMAHIRWLLLIVAIAGLETCALGQINISYTGPDRTHVTYAYNAGGGQAEAVFEVTDPGGGTRTLASAGGLGASVNGSLCDSDLVAGNYSYAIRARWYDTEEKTWSAWSTVAASSAHVDGSSATGTLLFDESLSGVTLDRVTVPEGLLLTLKGALSASSNGFHAISVQGTLAFDPADGEISLLPYYNPGLMENEPFTVFLSSDGQVVSGVNGGHFVLEGENTTLSDCRDIKISPAGGDLSLASVSNCLVYTHHLKAGRTLHASDSSFVNCDNFYNGTLDLTRVSWSGNLNVSGAGAVQANDVDFDGYVQVGNTGSSSTYSGSFQASDSRFNIVYVDRAGSGQASFINCLFSGVSGATAVFGGAASFTGCEFGGVVALKDRSATVIQGCLFLKELYVFNSGPLEYEVYAVPHWSMEGSSPVISGNAFMGDCALRFVGDLDGLEVYDNSYPPSPIAIGANFYGNTHGTFNDQYGYDRGYLPAAYKARVRGNKNGNNLSAAFSLATPLTSSPLSGARKDTRVFPRFWVNGHIIGQNTIAHQDSTVTTSASHILIQGRDTLLSVDLSCTEESLEKVRVYAVWNGVTVESIEKPEVRRDPATFAAALIRNGRSTFDFVLPGVQSKSVSLAVFLDTSDVEGYDENARPATDISLFTGTVTFCDPPQRRLNIAVMPVTTGGRTGNPGPTVQALRADIPNLLSIPAKLVNVQPCAPLEVWSPTNDLGSAILMNRVSAGMTIGRWLRSLLSDDTPDFIVAVMPSGLICSGQEGASYLLRRRIPFVDEQRPKAALHELGHAVGLCTDGEEYDLYPPDGLPVERSTLFMTETGGTRGRVRNLPYPAHTWYNSQQVVYDMMGSAEPSAPLVGTVAAFHAWFQENLTAPAASPYVLAVQKSPRTPFELPANTRRILLSGSTDSSSTFLRKTIAFCDVTALGADERAPGYGYAYRFQTFDSEGLQICDTCFSPTSDTAEWFATFDVPSGAVTVRVVDNNNQSIVKALSTCGLQSVSLHVNAPDGKIGSTFSANWSVQSERAPEPGQLTHNLYYRTGPTDSWHLFAGPTGATNIEARSTFLPDTDTLSLKLVSSDGLNSVETLAEGLSVPSRPPSVTIVSPRAGTVSQSNAIWRLEATVVDFTPENVSRGLWSSSLQGVLGPGPLLKTVLLPGEHLLRYEAFAGNGLMACAEVSVSVVEEMTTSDIGFDNDSLRLYNSHADPTGLTLLYVATGETNRFDLAIRNGGADTTARVRLYLTTPLAGETLAATVELSAAPFEESHVPLAFFAGEEGDYTVRAVLDQIDPPDTNLADNEGQWVFSPPHTITVSANSDYSGTVEGSGLYNDGVAVTISAVSQPGFAFTNWTEAGVEVSTETVYSFIASADRTLLANFVATQALISVACVPYSGGTASGGGSYACGVEAAVTAVPNTGYRFVNWLEINMATWGFAEVSTNAAYTFTVSSDRMLRAVFEAIGGDDPGVTVTLEEALDTSVFTVSTDGTAPWTGIVTNDAIIGGDAARSGSIGNSGSTWMSVSVSGPGTLTFWWKASTEADYDIGEFRVDDAVQASIDGLTDWTLVSLDLGAGSHELRWTYTKDDSEYDGDDCIWVDNVEFSEEYRRATTLGNVPYAWLDEYADLMSAADGDYETAASLDFDSDGYQTWQEYLAGTDPTNQLSVFRASLTLEGGVPRVTWDPDLGEERLYEVEGKADLGDAEWGPTNTSSRFFRVKVSIP